jgi:carbon-monoxide dehydrogenase small subunit
MPELSLTVNGQEHALDVPVERTLADALRLDLGLTGTKIACGEGHCGACSVQLEGVPVLSCITLAHTVDGREVTTIEGLAPDGELHPMQRAFHENHALQCGFCTPGMIMQAIDLLGDNPDPSDAEVREGIEGNLCRCTGYQNIVKAIQAAARSPHESGQEAAATAGGAA